MLFHITITDNKGKKEVVRIHALSLLEAGIVAEEQYEESLEKERRDNKDV